MFLRRRFARNAGFKGDLQHLTSALFTSENAICVGRIKFRCTRRIRQPADLIVLIIKSIVLHVGGLTNGIRDSTAVIMISQSRFSSNTENCGARFRFSGFLLILQLQKHRRTTIMLATSKTVICFFTRILPKILRMALLLFMGKTCLIARLATRANSHTTAKTISRITVASALIIRMNLLSAFSRAIA